MSTRLIGIRSKAEVLSIKACGQPHVCLSFSWLSTAGKMTLAHIAMVNATLSRQIPQSCGGECINSLRNASYCPHPPLYSQPPQSVRTTTLGPQSSNIASLGRYCAAIVERTALFHVSIPLLVVLPTSRAIGRAVHLATRSGLVYIGAQLLSRPRPYSRFIITSQNKSQLGPPLRLTTTKFAPLAIHQFPSERKKKLVTLLSFSQH